MIRLLGSRCYWHICLPWYRVEWISLRLDLCLFLDLNSNISLISSKPPIDIVVFT